MIPFFSLYSESNVVRPFLSNYVIFLPLLNAGVRHIRDKSPPANLMTVVSIKLETFSDKVRTSIMKATRTMIVKPIFWLAMACVSIFL